MDYVLKTKEVDITSVYDVTGPDGEKDLSDDFSIPDNATIISVDRVYNTPTDKYFRVIYSEPI